MNEGVRRTHVDMMVGAKYDLSRDFAPALTGGETVEGTSTVDVYVGSPSGLVVSNVQVIGSAIHWRMQAVAVGRYVVRVLARLSDGEILDHCVVVSVGTLLP